MNVNKLLLAAVVFVLGTAGAAAQTKVRFQVDFVPQGLYSGFFYALAKGYYTAEKLDVEMVDGRGSALTVEALASGNINIGEANSGVAALAIGQGRDIVSVGMFLGKSTFGFFVPQKSGINAIKDLAGKSLVMTPGTPEALMLPAVFKLASVNFEKQIEKIRPVSATAFSTAASWSKLVTPGLSTITSLPALMARTAMAARSAGTAAQTMSSTDGSSISRSAVLSGRSGKRSRKPARTRSSVVAGSKPAQVAPASRRPPTIW